MKNTRPQLFKLNEIFEKRIFRIPDYQRGFSWTNKQLSDFWGDLINLKDDFWHFTGTITVQKPKQIDIENKWQKELTNFKIIQDNDEWFLWTPNDELYELLYIVDGQQRVTTFLIFIQAIIESKILGINKNSELLNKFIKQGSKEKEFYLFGYEFEGINHDFLPKFLFNEIENYDKTKEDNDINVYCLNLIEAKEFFIREIYDFVNGNNLEEIKSLFNKFLSNFVFNFYEVDKKLDVYRVFETMNNRGKQLSKLELLKNRLIYLTTLLDEPDDTKNTLRNKINDVWKVIYSYLAKNKKKLLKDDDFLKVHSIMFFDNSEAGEQELKIFSEKTIDTYFTLDKLKNGQINKRYLETYLNSLEISIKNWFYIQFPDLSHFETKVKKWLIRIKRLSPNTFFEPIILAAIENEIDNQKISKLLSKIEKHEFLVFKVSGANSNKHRANFWRAASLFYRNKKSVDDIIDEIGSKTKGINGYYNQNRFWTTIDTLFNDNRKQNWKDWSAIKYLLFEYEEELRSKSPDHKILTDWNDCEIECVYPEEDYRDAGCWHGNYHKYGETYKYKLCYSLGNLVLLSKRRRVSERRRYRCFDEKKAIQVSGERQFGYSIGSYNEREIAQNEEWRHKEIKDRAIKILDFMEQRFDIQIQAIKDQLTGVNFKIQH